MKKLLFFLWVGLVNAGMAPHIIAQDKFNRDGYSLQASNSSPKPPSRETCPPVKRLVYSPDYVYDTYLHRYIQVWKNEIPAPNNQHNYDSVPLPDIYNNYFRLDAPLRLKR